MKKLILSLFGFVLATPAFTQSLDSSWITYPVSIPFRKLFRCAEFSTGTHVELLWPQTSDTGEGAELARFIIKHQGSRVFTEGRYEGKCSDFNHMKGTLKGFIGVTSVEQYGIEYFKVIVRLSRTGEVPRDDIRLEFETARLRKLDPDVLEWSSVWGEGGDISWLPKYLHDQSAQIPKEAVPSARETPR